MLILAFIFTGKNVYDTIMIFLSRNKHVLAAQGCEILLSILNATFTEPGQVMDAAMVRRLTKDGGILDFLLNVGLADVQTSSESRGKRVLASLEAYRAAIRVFAALCIRLPADAAVKLFRTHDVTGMPFCLLFCKSNQCMNII